MCLEDLIILAVVSVLISACMLVIAFAIPKKIIASYKAKGCFPFDHWFMSLAIFFALGGLLTTLVVSATDKMAQGQPLPKECLLVLALEKPVSRSEKYLIEVLAEKMDEKYKWFKVLVDVKPGEYWSETTKSIEDLAIPTDAHFEILPVTPGIPFQHKFAYYMDNMANVRKAVILSDFKTGFFSPMTVARPKPKPPTKAPEFIEKSIETFKDGPVPIPPYKHKQVLSTLMMPESEKELLKPH